MHFFKIAKNTFWQISAKLFSSLVGFLITLVIARSFGVLGYGDFIKITSFVAPFYLIIDFGLNAFYLQLKEKKYTGLFWLRIYISLIVFLLINVINIFLPYDQIQNIGYSPIVKIGIFIFSFSVFSQSVIFSSLAMFQQKLIYYRYMLSIVLGSLVNLFLICLFVLTKNSMVLVITAFVISGLVTALLAQIYSREKISRPTLNTGFSISLLKMSFPLALMLVFNLVYFRVDSIILAFLKPTADVGVYGLAYKFFDFLISLPLFLSNSLYPLLLQNKKNLRKLSEIVRSYSLIFLFFGIILIFPFWFLSPVFTFIKQDFAKSILPFRILLLSLPLFFISSFFQWILICFLKQRYLATIYFLVTIINVILNLIFIPQYSYIASAIITIASEGLIVILLAIRLVLLKNSRKGIQR